MIYITGDTHGDLGRFKHPMFRKIKKRDTLIICGDFGFIWDGSKREKRILKWLGKRRYDVLFVDGVHENFDELERYPLEEWSGGETRKISGKLRLLMRGNVFQIGDKKILAFGGGDRDDAGDTGDDEILNTDSSNSSDNTHKCVPSPEDFETAMKSLEEAENEIDYIISYEPPTMITEFLALNQKHISTSDNLSYYLDEINRKANYKRWFFGRHHIDKVIPPKYFSLFSNVINAEYNPTGLKNKI
ncbi:MAG: metallophosphoesterase [Oscillospiraceae bacterium]|nr:metallophosphoesterase [Oscillospiraceae bacterium]